MDQQERMSLLPRLLLPWYHSNHRDLPWRKDRDPYHIWVSEIMLQQTRVEAVKGYYARFLKELPTVNDLANCDDDLLHKLWEGLGYYSRVRNLKKAARQIVEQYDGIFPGEYHAWRALPGVGDYTAGAVCSIAYNLPTPAVDGNVLRVLSRINDDDMPIDLPECKKKAQRLLEKVYPKQAGDFTQALMELGATVCGPNRTPECEHCPCKRICFAFERGTAQQLPVKRPKQQRRHEQYTVFILCCDGKYAVEKRENRGLLADLWQFPNVAGILDTQAAIEQVESFGIKPKHIIAQVERKHIFTHIQWDMSGVYMETEQEGGGFVWVPAEQMESQIALPTAFRMFWEEKMVMDG